MQRIHTKETPADPREPKTPQTYLDKESQSPATNESQSVVNDTDKISSASKEALQEEEQDAEKNNARDAFNDDNYILPPDENEDAAPEE